MSVSQYLRFHSRVVSREPKPLVSPGRAFRFRKEREASIRMLARAAERRRAWSCSLDNPALSSKRRAELLAESATMD